MRSCFGVCLVALALGVMACGVDAPASDQARAATTDTRPAQRVRVAAVRSGQLGGLAGVAGLTSAFRKATVASQASAQVVQRHVEPGQGVAQGDALVTLDDAQLAIAVDEARATLKARQVDVAEARRELERGGELLGKGAISDGQHDTFRFQRDRAQSARDLADAALRRTQRSLADAVVRAPFAGTVERIDVQVGDFLAPGAPVAVVADFARVRLRAGVTAREAADLSPGDMAAVSIDALGGGELRAPVHSVGLMADETTGTYPVEVWLDNSDRRIRGGMVADLRLAPPDDSSGTVVPRAAILRRRGALSVYIAEGEGSALRAVSRKVRVGRQQGGWVELLEGVEPGERVVVEGLFALTEGAAIFVDEGAEDALPAEATWND
jgi:membrane fusion protein (multidrug efflux system)